MEHLDEIALDDLHDALDHVDGTRPTERPIAAIPYKNGVSQTEPADWFNAGHHTIYSWLKRLNTDDPLSKAVTNAQQSGINRKLSETELKEFWQTLQPSPPEVGHDESALATTCVKHHLKDAYAVAYSSASYRRIFKEAGPSYQKPRPEKTGPDDSEEVDEPSKIVRSWTPPEFVSIRPRPRSTATRHGPGSNEIHYPASNSPGFGTGRVCPVPFTEDGWSCFSWFPEYVTAEHTTHFIIAVYHDFEDNLRVVSDDAP